MKLVCSKSNLLKSVNIVLKAIPGKTTMPILECILIDASTNNIKFTANDMELGIETIVDGTILEKGIVAIDAKIFSDIIRKLPDNDVTIETDGNQFTLKEVIRQTIFSIAANENNKMMTGELFEVKGDMLRVVSLDGHRISIRKIELKEEYSDIKVVVPGKTLIEISKILSGETEDEVSIFFTKNHIVFEFDDTVVVSRLIEGEYFRIDQMLSSDYETKIQVNKKELLDCIDRATLLVKESDKKPIILSITDDNIELKIQSQIGSMDEEIDINKEGKDIMIGFNPRFLIDALRVIDDETVDIYLMNPKAPCFIRDEQQSYIYLILPVNFMA